MVDGDEAASLDERAELEDICVVDDTEEPSLDEIAELEDIGVLDGNEEASIEEASIDRADDTEFLFAFFFGRIPRSKLFFCS